MRLIGPCRLGKDATLVYTAQGEPVANFSAAYNFGKKDQDGKQKSQWVTFALFGKRAEALSPYLTKGKQVYIVANDVHVHEYPRKDGGHGVELKARIDDVQLMGSKDDARQESPKPAVQKPVQTGIEDLDSDIPF